MVFVNIHAICSIIIKNKNKIDLVFVSIVVNLKFKNHFRLQIKFLLPKKMVLL